MRERNITDGYAQALFDVASHNRLTEQVEIELKAISVLLEDNKDMEKLILHPSVSRPEKKRLVAEILGRECSQLMKNFLFLLIDKRRERLLRPLLDGYKSIARKTKGVMIAEVQSVMQMTDDQLGGLRTVLERLTGKKIEIESTINPKILGGLIIRIDNKLVNGSVRNQLLKLRKKLLQTMLA